MACFTDLYVGMASRHSLLDNVCKRDRETDTYIYTERERGCPRQPRTISDWLRLGWPRDGKE